MKNKILSVCLSMSIVLSSVVSAFVLTSSAVSSEGYSVAMPVNEIGSISGSETIHSEKLSNFTTTFNYTPTSGDSKLSLRYDYDSQLKKTVLDEDFESYRVNDNVYGSVTVTDGGARGLIGSVGQWNEGSFTAFKGTDFDATFWLYQNNNDWGKMNIKLKEGVQLIYFGAGHGGERNKISLYSYNGTVNDFPEAQNLLASLDLHDYGYDYVAGEIYYRVKVIKDNIKLYISSVNDFEGLEPVIDYTLPEDLAKEESELTFSQGNTGLFIDDLKVVDVTKPGYQTIVNSNRTYKEVFSENFESSEATAPAGGSEIVKDGNNKILDFKDYFWGPINAEFSSSLPKNRSTSLYIYGGSYAWDNFEVFFDEELSILFHGGYHAGKNGIYTAQLLEKGTAVQTVQLSGGLSSGAYVKIDLVDGLIKVYIERTNDFTDASPIITKVASVSSDKGIFKVCKYSNTILRIDDIEICDLDDYTEDINKEHTEKYGCVTFSSSEVALNEMRGDEYFETTSANKEFKINEKYSIAVLRDRDSIKVTVDGKDILKGKTQYDEKLFFGELMLAVEGGTVTDLKVYDSGRINFKNNTAVLVPYEVADDITALAASSAENKVIQNGTDLSVTVDGGQVNSAVSTSALLREQAGDIVLDFFVNDSRNDWINDTLFFGVPGEITNEENGGYQYDPSALYKEGYALEFGANSPQEPYYNLYDVSKGNMLSVKKRVDPISFHWGVSTGHIRLERKGNVIRIYMAMVGEKLELVDEVKADRHLIGNLYWYHRQNNANLMNIKAYDTSNRVDYTKDPDGDNEGAQRPAELVAFYSTTKTNKDILIEKSESTYEKIGPWYHIENPHRNATYLSESLTGDVILTDMDMSFEYYGQGHWMTNSFYFASSNKYCTTGYSLTIMGGGTAAGRSEEGYNLVLTRNYYGRSERLAGMIVPNLGTGAFKFHITINNGKIKVAVKPKNAPDSEACILEGDSGGYEISGGVYMYLYDACYARVKDIIIYDGTNTENSIKPDLSEPKQVLVENNFDDPDNIPVEQFKDEVTGVRVQHDKEKGVLTFDTNHNNYIQSAVLPQNDWLEDLTIQFDYMGHRGDWNLNYFAWHCSRKSGDRYSSLYLAVFGDLVANDVNNRENTAGIQGANIQLIASENGVKKCLAWANMPDINSGRECTIRITQEGGASKVWIWPSNEDMPTEPIITSVNYHPELCYGGFFVHSWCSSFSIDNLKILNYPDYTIIEPSSILNKEIGEIFRVDRVFEEQVKVEKEPTVVVAPVKKPIWKYVIPIALVTAATVAVAVVVVFVFKKRKRSV